MGLSPSIRLSAYGMVALLAIEQHYPAQRRIASDELAYRMLPLGARMVMRAYRWRALRNVTTRLWDRAGRGIYASILCRKRYGQDRIDEALASGVEQFVFLGAGFDPRGCRLASRPGVSVFETDLARNIAHKRNRIRAALGAVPDRLTLLPVDFEADDLGQALTTGGFQPEKPTMLVFEGVLPYLTPAAVDRIFKFLSNMAAGSGFIFSYVRKDFCDGTNLYGNEYLYRRFVTRKNLFHFSLAPEEIDDFLGTYGWTKREDVGAAEYIRWYLEPTRRDLPVSEIERFTYAEKSRVSPAPDVP